MLARERQEGLLHCGLPKLQGESWPALHLEQREMGSLHLPNLRGASGRAPLENIIYRSDRLPTLILMMGIWDNRSQVGVFLCQQSIQHGNSLTLHTRHGRHKEMACLQETQLVWSWRHISFLQPAGEATGADLEITSNVLNVSMVPTC